MTNNDRILSLIKERLEKGAEEYGEQVPIHSKSRDNLKESVEEALDISVYLCAFLLKLKDEYNKDKESWF